MITYSSYLVQRLKKPYESDPKTLLEKIKAHGLAATGLTSKAKEVLRKVCVFDYMGSAEYEFGAIPRILRNMAGSKLIAKVFPIPYYFKHSGDGKVTEGNRTIGVICCEEDLQEVTNRILKLAVGDPAMICKQRPQVDESLAEYEFGKDIYGWLELDNGYMFFKDLVMFERFCALFGLSRIQASKKKKGE